MNPIGRNDPCPCGSGKKYKKCCGAASIDRDQDLSYERIRRLDGESANLLMGFVRRYNGKGSLEDAWSDFVFSDEVPFSASHPEIEFFERWFMFNWQPEYKESLAELFLSDRGSKLGTDLHRF